MTLPTDRVFDGVDLGSLPLRTVRRVVRAVPQDVFLVSGSLRDNLLGDAECAQDPPHSTQHDRRSALYFLVFV